MAWWDIYLAKSMYMVTCKLSLGRKHLTPHHLSHNSTATTDSGSCPPRPRSSLQAHQSAVHHPRTPVECAVGLADAPERLSLATRTGLHSLPHRKAVQGADGVTGIPFSTSPSSKSTSSVPSRCTFHPALAVAGAAMVASLHYLSHRNSKKGAGQVGVDGP